MASFKFVVNSIIRQVNYNSLAPLGVIVLGVTQVNKGHLRGLLGGVMSAMWNVVLH